MAGEIRRIGVSPRLSMATVHGGAAYLSGQVAIEAGGGPVAEQAVEVLRRIDALLEEAGTDRTRLLSANLYVADLADLPEINRIWLEWLAGAEPPCRTTVEAKLASPRYALEISVVAAA
ncbi:MAG: RidA family protein [Caulobacterales bacterium]|nr:RidA family protein [Caulobacterales bacterium]